ncbi:MAG: YdcF family protein [Alphaproteobacteria bacterium]|nr:YdcF family protein [Alphaproteobacteria bacterium]
MKKRITAFSVFLATIFTIWFMGFLAFCFCLPGDGDQDKIITDAVVVLTGGKGRVQIGFSLVEKGLAQKLFISGVNPKVKMPVLLKGQGAEVADAIVSRAELGYNARNTIQNAQETAAWVRQQHIQSLRLVTSDYHMLRSMIEFARALPDVRIVPHPIHEGRGFDLKTTNKLLSEYHKLLWVYFGFRLS